MKQKKRLKITLLILLAVLLVAGLACFGVMEYRYYMDSQQNQYVLDVCVDSVEAAAGQVSFTVTNNGYIPVQLREVLLLSVYDQAGNPVFLDGSPYTDSSAELRSEDKPLVKALEKHQAVYVSEYALEAGKPLYEARSQWVDSGDNIRGGTYTLELTEDYILRLDLLLYGKPQAYPHADWSLLTSSSNLLENTALPSALEAAFASGISMPTFSASQAYHWELEGGNALLVDIGNVKLPNIVVPEKIWLSETADGYVEDPVSGTCYDVTVRGDAFVGNRTLETVTFRDGVSIANNTMWDDQRQGMFEGCISLTAVTNIPDSVVSMEDAFMGCTALSVMPQLPASVENLTNCFYNCSSLQEVSVIPDRVITAKNCFYQCTSLKEIPLFSEGIEDLSGCFYGCTSLQSVAPLPDSVTNMTGTFTNCSSLTSVSNFPASLTSIDNCFAKCSSLTEIPALPEGITRMVATFSHCAALKNLSKLPQAVEDLERCFEGCSSLESIPALPEHPLNLRSCFKDCISLSGDVTLPLESIGFEQLGVNLEGIFSGCENISSVVLPFCEKSDVAVSLQEDTTLTFALKHTAQGVCPGCNYVTDSFVIDGLPIYLEHVPYDAIQELLDFLDNEVPDILKKTCSKLTFTSNRSIFLQQGPYVTGLARHPSGAAYVYVATFSQWQYQEYSQYLLLNEGWISVKEYYRKQLYGSGCRKTMVHELAHCYDTNFSTFHRFSNRASWQQLCEEEGDKYRESLVLFNNYSTYEFPREMFAWAVADYFCNDYEKLGDGMKAFVEELFGEAA